MSRIFKSVHLNEKDKKLIEVKKTIVPQETGIREALSQDEHQEIELQKSQILIDAEDMAKRIIEQGRVAAEQLKADAKNEIDQWWIEQRNEDEAIKNNAEQQGFNHGYDSGFQKIEAELQNQYKDQIDQAKKLVEEAYQLKEQIIQESEPVVIQLAISIAEKIILKEVEQNLDIIKEITKEALRKTREYEKITIDVHPSHFSFLLEAKEELKLEMNGQVELLIYPDPFLVQGGCIIRTSTGTIDAKIDTQLEEIKKALLDLRENLRK